jgi:hypothetical protein
MNAKRKLLCGAGAVLAALTAASLLLQSRGSEGEFRSRARAPSSDGAPYVEPAALPAVPLEPPETEPVFTATRAEDSAPVHIEKALSELQAETAELSVSEQARLLRLPVISAIRSSQPSGETRHRAMREALEGSGPSDEPWTRAAGQVFADWADSISPELSRNMDRRAVRCFVAGCEVLVTFPDSASAETAISAFRSIRERDARHGGRVQTPPVAAGAGRVQVAWMLLRPDVALP